MADSRWKRPLLAGCAIALVWALATSIDSIGFFETEARRPHKRSDE